MRNVREMSNLSEGMGIVRKLIDHFDRVNRGRNGVVFEASPHVWWNAEKTENGEN